MKHIKSIILTLLGMLLTLPASAQVFEYDGIKYIVLDSIARTCSTQGQVYDNALGDYVYPNSSATGALVIPNEVKYGNSVYAVVEIGKRSFRGSEITSVSIPDGVTAIPSSAFEECKLLESAELPNSITTIGATAFQVCTNLSKINWPDSLKTIEAGAFNFCKFTSLNLPAGLEEIGQWAFQGNYSLTSVSLPASLSSVENAPFNLSSAIAEVNYDAVNPVSLDETLFPDAVYKKATLHAPNATLADIQATVPWKKFTHIVAKDSGSQPTENVITWMYPGANQLIYWGDNLSGEIVLDENSKECLKITNSEVGENWSSQFAFDYPYQIGQTYYFTFDVKGDPLTVTSNFQVSDGYYFGGDCEAFKITPNWTTITIKGTPIDSGYGAPDRWVANVGDFEGSFLLRNMRIYTIDKENPDQNDSTSGYEKIIAKMYPGLSQFICWGDNLLTQIVPDENGDACLEITNLEKGELWSASFAYDYDYKVGDTYYFTFDVKGDTGLVTSKFENFTTYTPCGDCESFQITPEWTTVNIKGTPKDTGEIVNRWVAQIGNYEGTFYIRNVKMYTYVEDPIDPDDPDSDNEKIMAEMYPGPSRLFYWGEGLSGDPVIDEDGVESLMITNSIAGESNSAQFAYDCLYEVGETYYFSFDVKGEPGVVESHFENQRTYTYCGSCGDFEITPEWTHVIIKGTPEETGETVNRWVASIGEYVGKFYIRNMKIYSIIHTEAPITPGEEFDYNGIRYAVVDPAAWTCKVTAPNRIVGRAIEIPEKALYETSELTVIAIDNEGFVGSDPTYVELPATIETVAKDAFEGCGRIVGLRWTGSRSMPADVMDAFHNPNILVYVDSIRFAPEGLDHNVVADGICENLVLTAGYPFSPSDGFTATKSSMTKEFTQQTAFDGCAGWETMVVPFDVTRITGPDGKTVVPFAAVTDVNRQRPFWLFKGDPTGEWMQAAEIRAFEPYLISMPNNPRYNPAYNISGTVTFSNPNPQEITPSNTVVYSVDWTSGRSFRTLWLPLDADEATNAMGINAGISDLRGDNGELIAPGSAFCAGVTPKPLEAYVTRSDAARAFPIRGTQSAVLTLTAAIDDLQIAQDGATLILESPEDRTVDIYAPDGTLLRRVELKAGESAYVDALPQGIVLVAGRKLLIR